MTDRAQHPPPARLEARGAAAALRMVSPSAMRNRAPILEVLKRILPSSGSALEVGSGTGDHVVFFAAAMPRLVWRPSDPNAEARASTIAWTRHTNVANVLAPLDIDVRAQIWGVEGEAPFDAIVSINMVHIAPWEACLGLFAGAARLLRDGAPLFLYGPFLRDGKHNAPSNLAFDASLKAQDPSWGLRDIAELERLGASTGLRLQETVAMPANNFSLVFAKNA